MLSTLGAVSITFERNHTVEDLHVTDTIRDNDDHAEQPGDEPSIFQRTLELLRQTDEQRLRDRLPAYFSD